MVSGAGVYPAIVIATHVLASVRGGQAHVHADVLRIRWWLRLVRRWRTSISHAQQHARAANHNIELHARQYYGGTAGTGRGYLPLQEPQPRHQEV